MHNQFKTQKFKHLMLAMGPRDLNSAPCSPVHCSSHSMTSFQSSELTELPVVENSQLFAQRTVRPHNPCRLGGPQCFRAGDKIRSGPQMATLGPLSGQRPVGGRLLGYLPPSNPPHPPGTARGVGPSTISGEAGQALQQTRTPRSGMCSSTRDVIWRTFALMSPPPSRRPGTNSAPEAETHWNTGGGLACGLLPKTLGEPRF